jgi:pimeloyl-ACP methyl ester carboxylesterase
MGRRASTVVCALLLVAGTAQARSAGVMVYKRATLERGVHWRIQTARGAVHVWQPPGYQARTAGLVVYIHGLGSSADHAWRQSRLAARFLASGRNALFIVPEGPRSRGNRVTWPDLEQLLRTVVVRTEARRPSGHVVVVAHSSGYQTAAQWTRHRRLKEIILLDGLYGRQQAFTRWLARDGDCRLVLVAARSRGMAEAWIDELPFVERRERIPTRAGQFRAEELKAQLLYLRSQYGHTEMVRVSTVLPVLLGASRLGQL